MYLHLGAETVIKTSEIVAMFDLDNTTISKHTRNYLANVQKNKKIVNVSYELPKSFVVCTENVYITQLSVSTLTKRINSLKTEQKNI